MIFKRIFTVFLLLAGLTLSCFGQKNTPYYKVKLIHYEDYTLKFNKVVDYLTRYSSDPESICTRVITDLVVFEEDILTEIEEDQSLTPYQLDTLDLMARQVKALRKFMDCMAWCSEYPVIQENELYIAADLLLFQTLETEKTTCSKTVECKKKDYHYYFLINTTDRARGFRYSYQTFNGENGSGLCELGSEGAAVIFGVFNDFSSDWIHTQNILCN